MNQKFVANKKAVLCKTAFLFYLNRILSLSPFPGRPFTNPQEQELLQRIDVKLDTAFKVTGFIFMNDIHFCKLIEHSRNLRRESLGSAFFRSVADSFQCVAGSLVVIPVANPSDFALAYSFLS